MIHLIKLSVGVDSLETLSELQARKTVEYYGAQAVPHRTRRTPRRADELLRTGGSIYWVINRRIQARQSILGFEDWVDPEGKTHCLIMNEPTLIKTAPYPHRAFQGWRYLEPEKAPEDRGMFIPGEADEPPEEMADDLRAAGLID